MSKRYFFPEYAEKRLWLLSDDRSRLSCQRIDLDDAVHLVAALVVLERHRMTVLAPFQRQVVVGVRKEPLVDHDLLSRVDVKEHWLFHVEDVTRLGVLERRVFRLQLIFGRRPDVVHVAAITRLDLVGGDLRRVRRPDDRIGIVVAAFRSVDAEERGGRLPGFADGHVVVADEGLELAIWRLLRRDGIDVDFRAHGSAESAAASSATAFPAAAPRRRVI